MFFKPASPRRGLARRQDGLALFIVLSMIVVVTILFVLFLNTTRMSRQISSSSAGQARAEALAQTGLETTISDLRTEIVAGSTVDAGPPALYRPTTNATVLPARVGAPTNAPNLLKRSLSGQPFWSGAAYAVSPPAPNRAASISTASTNAISGRYIRSDRWNLSYLLGTNLPTGFQPPDWILVTRAGPVTDAAALPAVTVLRDSAPGNSQFAIGRYAYLIFDQGGLLDATVAGFPAGVSADFTSRRSVLPQVNLSKISGVDAANFVQWRNVATRSPATTYETNALHNTNGFTEVAAGDRTLFSRQDLIAYAKTNSSQIPLSALQYLATFNRSLNAPSFTPDSPTVTNPSLSTTRVTTAFTRNGSDGQPAVVGEPLLKYRFPLSRLALFSSAAVDSPSVKAQIEQWFGLSRADAQSPWVYRNGAATILTLSQVAAAGREPDFFELLQAGIWRGSLGANMANSAVNVLAEDLKPDVQIMQIGANLMDQYDANSLPTRLSYANSAYEISGLENLPYLSRIIESIYRKTGTDQVGMWYEAEVWNPHAQINLSGPSSTPTQFRFRASGTAGGKIENCGPGPLGGSLTYTIPDKDLSTSPGIEFSTSGTGTFTQPAVLKSGVGGATAVGNDDQGSFLGITIGIITIPMVDMDNGQKNRLYYATPQSTVDFELQYFDPVSSSYITYDRVRKVKSGVGVYIDGQIEFPRIRAFFARSDARTDRFGPSAGYPGVGNIPLAGETIRSTAANGWLAASGAYIGTYSDNLTSSASHYADPDGTTRPADGAYATGLDGRPLATTNFTSRPVVLNRPFRSVGEMGYASRGAPWKHLDFFHTSSGDAALLDLFTVAEPSYATSQNTPRTEAGRVSLNTRNTAVLETLIDGALQTEDNGALISPADMSDLANRILAVTTNTPFLNRSSMVTSLMTNLPTTGPNFVIKRRREAVIRALGDIGDTRTWNLLIDLIAQSGRYPRNAANLTDFQVDGERHYWLHVAIDRLTGEVIARRLEVVNE